MGVSEGFKAGSSAGFRESRSRTATFSLPAGTRHEEGLRRAGMYMFLLRAVKVLTSVVLLAAFFWI